jgi:hypothetical protein
MYLEVHLNLKGFDKKVYRALRDQLRGPFGKVGRSVTRKVQKRFSELFNTSDTVRSLISGDLRGMIGVENPGPEARLTAILNQWINSVVFTPKPISITQKGLTGGFRLEMMRSDFTDVLRLNEAFFPTPSNEFKANYKYHPYNLEWLRWLLLEGSKVVVEDFDFIASNRGRTGRGTMKKKGARRWSVPPEFAGTAIDNFATQIIAQLHTELDQIFLSEISRIF